MKTIQAALSIAALVVVIGGARIAVAAEPIRSARSGPWSEPGTWESGNVPGAGASVQVRAGHTVTYDVQSDRPIRFIHVAGTLTFAPDRNTRLDVGVIKIEPGEDASEQGFDCDAHVPDLSPGQPRPALEVGSTDRPIAPEHSALIRLVYFDGMDKDSCPALVCCGGRMDFHGAPLSRTWLKLGAPARAGDTEITLQEPVQGWRIGDRLIVTATTRQNKLKKTFQPSVKDSTQTEERVIQAIEGTRVTLDAPLKFDHVCDGAYRADVANLSRNVTIESAEPDKARGHTMYHRGSAASIRYAEFRHLGKPGVLGRYSLHFHKVADTMRGSSVIGASIWDSGNRWITIHGTNYLVVRDCVGYRSLGHGFFLEDGTEVYNVLDHNLAVQALSTPPLPLQIIPFDKNDGSGFWWANSLNTFTRNTAAECDEYGYFFQATETPTFNLTLPIEQPDGNRRRVDIRTLPFVRFEDNEAHCQRRHAFNLGGGVPFGVGVGGVGPDFRHPFVIRNFKAWNTHWAIHPLSPSVLIENLDIYDSEYAIWRPNYDRHAYRGIHMKQITINEEFTPTGTRPKEADFPQPLEPVDDMPPATVITQVIRSGDKQLIVRGTTSDNGKVTHVLVSGHDARAVRENFAEWETVLTIKGDGPTSVSARAEDSAGNGEPIPHVVRLDGP
jgi:hypothetical protein